MIKLFLAKHKIAVVVAALVLIIGLFTGTYIKGRGDGRDATQAEYAQKALEVAQAARMASEQATADKDNRDDEYALEQGEIADVVQKEYDNGGDPVAKLLSELRKSQLDRGKTSER